MGLAGQEKEDQAEDGDGFAQREGDNGGLEQVAGRSGTPGFSA